MALVKAPDRSCSNGGAGLWFNTQQREREQRIADYRAQDDSLQAYLDGMSQLLTDKDQPLHRAQSGDHLGQVAQARTLTVLGTVDGSRKRSVLRFLYESGLIYTPQAPRKEDNLIIEGRHTIVSLRQANLQGTDLRGFNVRDADLSGADLSSSILQATDLWFANLSGANLSGTHLDEANLSMAFLIDADLSGAYLSGAYLSGAYLSGAILRRAGLREADLSGARDITAEELEQQTRSLEGATMPNGQKYEDWLKSRGEENSGLRNRAPQTPSSQLS